MRKTGFRHPPPSQLAERDAVGEVLELGASSIVAHTTLLDLSVGMGLTDDSPDFQIKSSVSYRF